MKTSVGLTSTERQSWTDIGRTYIHLEWMNRGSRKGLALSKVPERAFLELSANEEALFKNQPTSPLN
jgi:hypothetical protein